MDQIDCNSALSREGKERQRRKAAAQAVADFEASKTLARAREAVEFAVAKHNIEPEARDATLKAMKEAEQGWSRAMDEIGERASLTKGSRYAAIIRSLLVRGDDRLWRGSVSGAGNVRFTPNSGHAAGLLKMSALCH